MRGRFLWLLVLTVLMQSVAWAALQQVTVKTIRLSAATQRLVIEVDGPFKYRSFTLDDPNRLVVDILDARLSRVFRRASFHNTPIIKMRSGVRHGRDLRLVFDLKHPINKHDFTIIGKAHEHSRLVVDWSERGHQNKQLAELTEALRPVSPLLKPQLSAKKRMHRDLVIVLDPGHGGRDPGATGTRGTHEKDIVLRIAKLVKQELDKKFGVRVIMTRNGDYYVPLRKRIKFARKGDADIFVSIHADAYQEGRSSGASVYALSQRGASSEVARWIADRENYSELGGVDLNDLQDSSDVLRTMLLDLSQTATIASSIQLGEYILKDLKRVVSLHKHKVEQAPFVVLKSPDIPSLLVEIGFISNEREERQLNSSRHQQRLASAIAAGIVSYGEYFAPSETHFAERYGKRPVLMASS